MRVVALSPHGDDLELFAAAQLVKYQPDVVVVFRSAVQEARGGASSRQRELESAAAMEVFGCAWEQWPYPDDRALPATVLARVQALTDSYDLCIAPAVEIGGHEQHNEVAVLAQLTFDSRLVPYLTYRRGYGRSKHGIPVELCPEAIAKKHLALACHLSQIEDPSTRPWFLDELREWVAS